ncbi:hypothetical protein LZ30DRAFT_775079 [Colletotrichum cereale]|nr:hypothetical protein LZ30DRAFT_775079 [Colletotrichum cereale]
MNDWRQGVYQPHPISPSLADDLGLSSRGCTSRPSSLPTEKAGSLTSLRSTDTACCSHRKRQGPRCPVSFCLLRPWQRQPTTVWNAELGLLGVLGSNLQTNLPFKGNHGANWRSYPDTTTTRRHEPSRGQNLSQPGRDSRPADHDKERPTRPGSSASPHWRLSADRIHQSGTLSCQPICHVVQTFQHPQTSGARVCHRSSRALPAHSTHSPSRVIAPA